MKDTAPPEVTAFWSKFLEIVGPEAASLLVSIVILASNAYALVQVRKKRAAAGIINTTTAADTTAPAPSPLARPTRSPSRSRTSTTPPDRTP